MTSLTLTFQFQMYIAYGSALYSGKASTNLHIDMSDAVNCLVYVGFPSDGNPQENAKEVFKEVDKAGMFALTPLTILALGWCTEVLTNAISIKGNLFNFTLFSSEEKLETRRL